MKTLKFTTILAAAAMLVCSCAKELANNVDNGNIADKDGILTLTIGLEDTKVSLGEKGESGYPLTWSEGDYLVLEGVKSNVLTAEQAGGNIATFTFAGSFSTPYNLIYCGKEGSEDIAVFPATQQYAAGTFASFSAPLYGTGSDLKTIKINSLNSVLRIPFNQDVNTTIKKILVEAVGGEIIAGEFTLVKSEGAYDGTMTAPAIGGKSIVTLDCGDGVSLADAQVPFYISVPAGSYSSGLKVYVINSDNQAMILTASKFTNVTAGKVYEFQTRDYVASETYVIATPEDMDILPTLINANGVGKTAILIDDIDMSDREWTSFGSGGTAAGNGNFSATLDGKEHTITGLTQPLFGNFGGTLKDITIESNIDWTSLPASYVGSTWGLGIVAGYAARTSEGNYTNTTLDNVTVNGSIKMSELSYDHGIHFGGLVGCNNGATIKNCTNNASLDISVPITISSSGLLSVGGVCGLSQTAGMNNSFTDNVNTGEIKVSSTLGGKFTISAIGGVIGRVTSLKSGEKVANLRNTGKITLTGTDNCTAGNYYLAGVCGSYEVTNPIEGWSNEGEINDACAFASQGSYVGGVIGRVTSAASSVKDLSNSGQIKINEGFTYAWSAIGGVIAHITAAVECDNMNNTGDIQFTASSQSKTSSQLRLGGVIGHVADAKSNTLKNSTNSGDISITNGASTSGAALGGLIGNIKTTSFTGTGNVNKGNITYTGTNSSGNLHLGGCYGRVEPLNATTIEITGVAGTHTNTGIISLNDTDVSNDPHAGGVIGDLNGGSSNNITLTLSNCSNNGELCRTVSSFGGAYKMEQAGGIIGLFTNAGGTITNCSNSAQIQFSANDGTATPLKNEQESGKIGGIIGRISANNGLTIKNCHNSGNIPSVEGYCGGIAGYVWNATIEGEKGNFCTNTGNIAYRDDTKAPQTTAGGIIGGGTTNAAIKWCYNTGNVAGNGGVSGLVGRVINSNSVTIEHCKSYCKVDCTSSWAKAGFLCGFTSGVESATTLLSKMSYVATGGQYRYSTSGEYKVPTAEDYVNHLYYNKVTAPTAAQSSVTATEVITADAAENTYHITLWDGSSTPSWEN